MNTNTLGLFLRHLALSEEVGRLGTASDRSLLANYDAERGQAAFTELMRRHGPMVLRTCRRVLSHEPDAEDAFQATFVVLARKAGTLCGDAAGPVSLGGWLHRVASQTALNVLAQSNRRRAREIHTDPMTYPDPANEATWNEVRPILDSELNALPEEARRLLIACYLQGKTHADTAAELGLPLGSVARRLEKARALLAQRLVRRGITVSAALLAVLLGDLVRGAGLPAVLMVHSVEAAVAYTQVGNAAVSARVAQLVKGSLATMTAGSTRLSLLWLVIVGFLGAGLVACQTLMAWPATTLQPPVTATLALGADQLGHTDRYGDPLPPAALARLGTVRFRHVAGVRSVAFTSDGDGLLTAGWGVPTRLWEVANGRMLRQFGDDPDEQAYAVELSPDGRTLAGRMRSNGDVGLWDVAKGTLLQRLKAGRPREDGPIAFSPDSKTVATGDAGTRALHLWVVATGKEKWAVNPVEEDPQRLLSALTFSADGKTLIWATIKGQLYQCDAATGNELRQWHDENHRPISALTRSPDGPLFAVYGPAEGVSASLARLWDVSTGKELWRLGGEEWSDTTAAFSPDGKILATGHGRGPLRFWDAATGKELRRCSGCQSAQCLAFSLDGKTLASGGGGGLLGSQDQTIRFWDVASGREVHRADGGHHATVCSLTFTPDGKDIVASSWDGSLRIWDAAAGEERRQVAPAGDEQLFGSRMASMTSALSPDGKTIFTATWDRNWAELATSVKVRRWDRATGVEGGSWSRELGNRGVCSVDFSPDGKTVACTNWEVSPNQVYLWDMGTGKEVAKIAGGYPAFSQDSKLLATAPWNELAQGKKDGQGSFTLWEAATGRELCSVQAPAGYVHRLLFSPDGRALATACNDNRDRNEPSVIHLWPLLLDESKKSSVRIGPPQVLAQAVPSLLELGVAPNWFGAWAFSPDGRTLALAGEGGTVRLLETATGKERVRFSGHGGDVTVLSFSPDGRRLASGSRDTTILVWDVTGRLRDGQLSASQLSEKELEACWADLAADDAGRACRAVWTLAAAPEQALRLLTKRVQPVAPPAPEAVAMLIHDLDDDAYDVRVKARRELEKLGPLAERAMREARQSVSSAEVRKRLDAILATMDEQTKSPSGDAIRGLRAVEVLEQIGGRDAKQMLKALAAGASRASLTEESRFALERLERAHRR